MHSLLLTWPQIQSREQLVTLNSSATISLVHTSCLAGQYYGMQSLGLHKAIFFSPFLQFPAHHIPESGNLINKDGATGQLRINFLCHFSSWSSLSAPNFVQMIPWKFLASTCTTS